MTDLNMLLSCFREKMSAENKAREGEKGREKGKMYAVIIHSLHAYNAALG